MAFISGNGHGATSVMLHTTNMGARGPTVAAATARHLFAYARIVSGRCEVHTTTTHRRVPRNPAWSSAPLVAPLREGGGWPAQLPPRWAGTCVRRAAFSVLLPTPSSPRKRIWREGATTQHKAVGRGSDLIDYLGCCASVKRAPMLPTAAHNRALARAQAGLGCTQGTCGRKSRCEAHTSWRSPSNVSKHMVSPCSVSGVRSRARCKMASSAVSKTVSIEATFRESCESGHELRMQISRPTTVCFPRRLSLPGITAAAMGLISSWTGGMRRARSTRPRSLATAVLCCSGESSERWTKLFRARVSLAVFPNCRVWCSDTKQVPEAVELYGYLRSLGVAVEKAKTRRIQERTPGSARARSVAGSQLAGSEGRCRSLLACFGRKSK